jgi:hypothetical protein
MRYSAALAIAVTVCIPAAAQHQPGYSVTIAAVSQHFESTNDIAVDIVITNISNDTVLCERGPVSGALDIAFQYDVRTADGHPIPRNVNPHPEIGSVTSGWPCRLEPGDTARSIAFVGRFYDMHSPGKYLIQISQKDLTTEQIVKSNQIEVTVDAPQAPDAQQMLQIVLSPENVQVASTDDLSLTAHVCNISNKIIDFRKALTPYNLDLFFDYKISDSTGGLILSTRQFGSDSYQFRPRALMAGQCNDYPIGGLMTAYRMRQPGVYTVQVSRYDLGHLNLLGTSNTIAATVTAPK